jgi:WD40 repeat protein
MIRNVPKRLSALWALLLLSGCSADSEPVLRGAGVLELPYVVQSMAWHPDGKQLAVGYFYRDEVQVWDVQTRQPVFAVPSKRRPVNQSGQEVVFSPDGKYLVVEDFLDTKNGKPKFPRRYEDPDELPAQQDKERYVLARVWDLGQRKEIAQIKGPGSVLYGGVQFGFCWLAGKADQLAVHLKAVVQVHDMPSARLAYEVNALHPFADKSDRRQGYWKMACHPRRPEVALDGGALMKNAPDFGFPLNSGATPIVVADLDRKVIKKVLFSATPLRGVVYSADGGKLVSFGMSPVRIWDSNRDFAAWGEIENPPQLEWVRVQRTPPDVLHPPAHAPRGNSGYLTAVPNSDFMIGVASDFHFWDTAQRRIVATVPSPRNIFRISLHEASLTLAAAAGNRVFFYRVNAAALQRANQGR